MGLGGGVETGGEGIGPGVATGGVGAPAGGVVPAVSAAGGVGVDGDDDDVVLAEPSASSSLYSAAFSLNASATVKAIAIKDGVSSSVASKAFVKSE